MTGEPQSSPAEGLAGSLRRLGDSMIHVLQTRLEILSTEVAEERFNLTRVVVVVLAAQFCFQAGALLAILFLVLTLGRDHWLTAIGIAALVLIAAALGGALWLRGWLKRRPPMFATSLAELRKDRDRLTGKS